MLFSTKYWQKGFEGLEERVEDPPQEIYQARKPVLRGGYTMASSILGLCFLYGSLVPIQDGKVTWYTNPIVLQGGLQGEDAQAVLTHEQHHEQFPMDSELETRVRTNTLKFTPDTTVSYV